MKCSSEFLQTIIKYEGVGYLNKLISQFIELNTNIKLIGKDSKQIIFKLNNDKKKLQLCLNKSAQLK